MDSYLDIKKPLLRSFLWISAAVLLIMGVFFYLFTVRANAFDFQKKVNSIQSKLQTIQALEYQFHLFNWKEKEFLMHGTHPTINHQKTKSQEAKLLITDLNSHSFLLDDYLNKHIQGINVLLDSLQSTLPLMVQFYTLRGFKDHGLEGSLRASIHKLESENLHKVLILSLRRSEKDFFLRKDLNYLVKFNKQINQLKNHIRENTDSVFHEKHLNLVNNYQNDFAKIVDIEQKIGLKDSGGLKGKRRAFFYKVLEEISLIKQHVNDKIERFNQTVKVVLIVVVLLFAVLFFLLIKHLIKKIEKPFNYFQKNISALSKGLPIIQLDKTNLDEFMLAAVNPVEEIDLRLSKLQEFTEAIGKKDFDKKLDLNTKKDELAKSLSNMRDQLSAADQLGKQRQWLSDSISNFIEDTKKNQEDIDKMLSTALINICRRNNFNQGAYYIYEASSDTLVLKACYAFNREKFKEKELPSGDGLVGQCFLEKQVIELKEIPDNYFNITSGLGDALPKHLFLFPLIYENEVIGVLELASFYELKEVEVQWLNKANEHIAGIIVRLKAQEELHKLFEESKASQVKQKEIEEQLQQNLEEIRATQEEMELRENEYLKKIEVLEQELHSVKSSE